jgi:archaellum biogenesis ATPase FlaH
MDAQEIRKWHSVFKRDDELFEIRILGDRTWSGYFYDIEEAIKQLQPFDNCNIYYTINEVKKACASRDQFNCFRQVRGTATSKNDIEHRWWMAVDVDCERPSGVSSTNEEKAKAHKKAQDVFVFLRNNGFSTPVVCDSSSGYHILYPIDMDNTQESEDAIKEFLEILANNFTDESVKIDTVLHDSNRILRLSGSYGRKGRSSEDRPHRLAKILSVPSEIVRMKVEQIQAFNDKYRIKVELPQRRQFNGNTNHEEFNLREFIQKYGIEVSKEVPLSGGGTKYVLAECPFDSQHKSPDSALFELPNGAVAFKCYHNSCSKYDWRAFRLHFDPHAYDHENESRPQPQYRQYIPTIPTKPKYEIKEEIPELGEKWMPLSSVEKVDLTKLEKVKTGFTELDNRVGGLYMSEVTILSGSNASGKSSWLNSVILNIIQQNYKVALWSGELRADILKSWIQMVAAGKDYLRPSQFEQGQYYVPDSIGSKIDAWLDGMFYLYNNKYGNVASQVLHDIKILTKAGVKVFVIDNMMSMNIDVFDGDKNEKQKQFILALKDFAMEEQVHVILVAHPRKSVAFLRKTDISGSGDIINAVDNCFIFHRVNEDFIHAITEFYDAARASQLRQYGNVLAVEKNRLRGVVDLMVGMQYEIESRRFKNYIDEDIHYDWENIGVQQTFQSTLDRSINTLQNTFGGMEVVDNNQPFGSPQLDNCPF